MNCLKSNRSSSRRVTLCRPSLKCRVLFDVLITCLGSQARHFHSSVEVISETNLRPRFRWRQRLQNEEGHLSQRISSPPSAHHLGNKNNGNFLIIVSFVNNLLFVDFYVSIWICFHLWGEFGLVLGFSHNRLRIIKMILKHLWLLYNWLSF